MGKDMERRPSTEAEISAAREVARHKKIAPHAGARAVRRETKLSLREGLERLGDMIEKGIEQGNLERRINRKEGKQ